MRDDITVYAWRLAHGRLFAGASSEIYGDPDPSGRVEVRIDYLLAPNS